MGESNLVRRDHLRRGGFTLLEVTIALAIFAFGALAIIRIFPPALGVIQNSGDQVTAVNLNRSTLARLQKEPDLLPDAIFGYKPDVDDVDGDGNTTEDYPLAVSTTGTRTRNNALPNGPELVNFNNSALNQFITISGEKHTVHVGHFFDPMGSPTDLPYVVLQHPLDLASNVTVYKEGTIDGVVSTSTTSPFGSGNLDFTNATKKPSDFGTTSTDTDYLVSYKYFEAGNLYGVVDENYQVSNPAAPTNPLQLAEGDRLNNTPAQKVVDGPVNVRYRNKQTGATPDSHSNPQSGLLVFPLAATSGLNDGDVISIDYNVLGWDWIVTDGQPTVLDDPIVTPTPIPGTAKALILPIRLLSDTKPVNTLLTYTDPITLTNPIPFFSSATWSAPPTSASSDTKTLIYVDSKAGRVTFNTNYLGAPNPNQKIINSRVVYQTLDHWTQQLSVAARSYVPYYQSYALAPTRPTSLVRQNKSRNFYQWELGAAQDKIFFPPSEAGKSVLISYSYLDTSVPGPPKVVDVNDQVVNINQKWIDLATTSLVPSNERDLAYATGQIAYAQPAYIATTGAAYNLVSIRSVRGASVQARTAWLDGDHYTQVSSIGFRGETN